MLTLKAAVHSVVTLAHGSRVKPLPLASHIAAGREATAARIATHGSSAKLATITTCASDRASASHVVVRPRWSPSVFG